MKKNAEGKELLHDVKSKATNRREMKCVDFEVMGRSKTRKRGRNGGNGKGSANFCVEMMVRPREERKGKDLQIDVEKEEEDDSWMEFGNGYNLKQHRQHKYR